MIMTTGIIPTKEQIKIWIKKYVPDKDFFFIDERSLNHLEGYLTDVLVIPKGEFFNHSSYNQIDLINSNMYWNISSEAKYVIIANPEWVTKLSEQERKKILELQSCMGRGLIFPLNCFSSITTIPIEYIITENEEKYVVIQNDMWRNIPYEIKESSILLFSKLWENWTCFEVPEHTPLHIRRFANKFATNSGSNCLSATLFAITKQDWIINEWVHQETFKHSLQMAGYFPLENDDIWKGDVVVWVDSEGVIQHASYHIVMNLFFNKNGQTFFNPWTITDLNELSEKWQQYKMIIYRKN